MANPWRAETYWVIGHHEFDELARKHLGIENYEIVADEELHNDMVWRIGAIPCSFWDEYDEKRLAKALVDWKACRCASRVLAHELCRRDIIPHGDWLVEVSW